MKLKFPSAYTILFIITALMALATWIVPTGYYKYQEPSGEVVTFEQKSGNATPLAGTYERHDSQQPQGIMDILKGPIKGFYDGKDIIVLVLILGGFMNIALSSGAVNSGVIGLMKKLKGRENLMIPILMIIFSITGTLYGAGEELVAYFPVLVPVLIVAGYDKLVATSIILLGAGIGVLSSTVNPFAVGIASSVAGISIADGMLLRVIILTVNTGLGTVFLMRYSAKIKKDITLSRVYDTYQQDKKRWLGGKAELSQASMTTRQKLVLVTFAASFAFMVYAVIPFNEIGLGFIPTLGWWFDELSAIFFGGALLMALFAGLSEKELVHQFLEGVKDLSGVAIIIGIARGVKVIMVDGGIDGTILNWGEQLVTGLASYAFISGVYFIELMLSFLIPSSSGLAAFSVPILAPLATFAAVETNIIVTAFHTANGLVNLLAPTSAILMAGLTFAEVPYNKWLSFTWPLLLALALASLLFMCGTVLLF